MVKLSGSLGACLTVALLVLTLTEARPQGYAPETAVRKMKVPDGFAAKLVASEPLVRQPVAIDFDDFLCTLDLEIWDHVQPIRQPEKPTILFAACIVHLALQRFHSALGINSKFLKKRNNLTLNTIWLSTRTQPSSSRLCPPLCRG